MPCNKHLFSLYLLGLPLLAAALAAPSKGMSKPRLDAAKVVETVSREFQENYVFPDVAQKMEAALQANLAAGRYRTDDPVILAARIKDDLISVSHDKHINVYYLPKDPGNPEHDSAAAARELAAMTQENFGFKKLEILAGNVGYIDLRSFMPAEFGGPTAVAAMKYMANTRALIFDLRNNGGGSPSMIQLLTSYLLPQPTHLNSFYVRKTGSEEQFWTPAYVDGPRYLKQELYILTSGDTFSAAEEFTYNLKNLKRATVVGENTGGGAHPVNFHFMKDIRFAAMIPFGRAINPITKTNWEGSGVEPDVKVNHEQALSQAHSMALKNLLTRSQDPDEKRRLSWALETLKAQQSPLTLKPETLKSYVGQYGDRTITLENDQLVYTRGARKSRLIPIEQERFVLEGIDGLRVQFDRDGKGQVVSLSRQHEDGRIDKSERSQ